MFWQAAPGRRGYCHHVNSHHYQVKKGNLGLNKSCTRGEARPSAPACVFKTNVETCEVPRQCKKQAEELEKRPHGVKLSMISSYQVRRNADHRPEHHGRKTLLVCQNLTWGKKRLDFEM